MSEKEKASIPQQKFEAGGITYWLPERFPLLEIDEGIQPGAVTHYGVCALTEKKSFESDYYDYWDKYPAAGITIDEDTSSDFLEWILLDFEKTTGSEIFRDPDEAGFEHWGDNCYSPELLGLFLKKIEEIIDELALNPLQAFKKYFQKPSYLFYELGVETGSFENNARIRQDIMKEEQYTVLARHAKIIKRFYQQFHDMMQTVVQDFPDANAFVIVGP